MPKDPTPTREKIMDAAEALILQYGFKATAVDRVIERAGVTKGTFFYHFKSKDELARVLVERFAAADGQLLTDNLARAEAVYEDPLDQILHFIRLFEEMLAELDEPYPGCLFASYISEAGLFEDDTIQVARNAFMLWRKRLGEKFRQAAEIYPTRHKIDPESLADGILVVFEGAFLLSKTYLDPGLVADQLAHYRRYVALLHGRE
jgi:TetR/AcrR family transcriptional repressor of nem operon